MTDDTEKKETPPTEAEFMQARAAAHNELMRLLAEEMNAAALKSGGNMGMPLLELRMKTELLQIDVNAIVVALISTGAVERVRYLSTTLELMRERVKQLSEAQSRLILATARPGRPS